MIMSSVHKQRCCPTALLRLVVGLTILVLVTILASDLSIRDHVVFVTGFTPIANTRRRNSKIGRSTHSVGGDIITRQNSNSDDSQESATSFFTSNINPLETVGTFFQSISGSGGSNSSKTTTSLKTTTTKGGSGKVRIAQELIRSLIEDDQCYTAELGARKFGDACAANIVYEDCYEPQPFVGRTPVTNHMLEKVAARKGKGGFRIDKISDGNKACGFAWTWTSGDEEGLRGTTFVELNDSGEIQYVREIPEPIFKPGDLTVELLKAVTQGAEKPPPVEYEKRTPTIASEVAKYLFKEVQGSSVDESMRFFDERIVYRDFNYEEPFKGGQEVREFIEEFNFPGITFRPQRFDDGIASTCFTWEVALEGAEDTIKGISYYELNPANRLISYVRDVPESAIKPPILGKLARQLRPGLGVFQGVKLGSRPGGM